MTNCQWIRELSALPEQELITLASDLAHDWKISTKALPQSGLGMLKLKDAAFHQAYYLGEFPLSTAHITLTTGQGVTVEGAASLMSDKQAVVEALAIFDAVLRHRLDGIDKIEFAIARGREAIRREDKIRQSMLQRTRVDFSLLSSADEDA